MKMVMLMMILVNDNYDNKVIQYLLDFPNAFRFVFFFFLFYFFPVFYCFGWLVFFFVFFFLGGGDAVSSRVMLILYSETNFALYCIEKQIWYSMNFDCELVFFSNSALKNYVFLEFFSRRLIFSMSTDEANKGETFQC